MSVGCSRCNCITFNQEWFDAFGVVLCAQCKKQEELISKGTAKKTFLLSDSDFAKLGSLSKQNPHRKEWNAMRLYLLSQVEAASYRKHGGPDGLRRQQQKLLDARLEARTKKRQLDAKKGSSEQERLERTRQRIERDLARSGESIGGEVFDETAGRYQRTYGEGVEVEEL